MTTYNVNMSVGDEVASERGVIAAGIEQMLTDLNTAVTTRLADWQAISRALGYQQAQDNWNRAAADMPIQADNARKSLSSILENYQIAEIQGRSLWGG